MNKALLLSLLSLPLVATSVAHADPVSDRVFLQSGGVSATGCPANSKGFQRIKQNPDGSETRENSEFVVPQGMYLEITSVQYITPYGTGWAADYAQWLDITINQKVGTAKTSVLNATYQNGTVYGGDNYAGWQSIGEVVAPGSQSHVASFPVGPLMNSNGHLCATPQRSEFWNGGWVWIRGRLIPTGSPVATTTGTNSL